MYYFVNPFHVFAVFKLKLSTFVCRAGLVVFSDHPCLVEGHCTSANGLEHLKLHHSYFYVTKELDDCTPIQVQQCMMQNVVIPISKDENASIT